MAQEPTKKAKTSRSKQQLNRPSEGDRSPPSHEGSTATLLDMRPTLYQGQRSFDDYTLQLATLEEQNKRRQQAYEQRQAISQPSSPANGKPAYSNIWQAPTSHPWSASTGGSSTSEQCPMDAIRQYQRMLLEEQRRRNDEMRRSSPI